MADDDNVTELNQKGKQPKTPEQILAEAMGKVQNRRQQEFSKTIDELVIKKVAAEKALNLIDKEIDDAMARFKAGL